MRACTPVKISVKRTLPRNDELLARLLINEIEVLPLSTQDDQLRNALYRAIYSWDSPLFRYATQSVPPVHIIVRNGRAELKGVVASKADADLAYLKAKGVPGLFDVKNGLQVESERPR